MDDRNLPLLELFTRLQNAGLPLGINEYKLVLKSLQGGFGISDKAALKRLCQTLWVKSEEEKRLFDYHFEQVIVSENNYINSGSSNTIVSDSENSAKLLHERRLTHLRSFISSTTRAIKTINFRSIINLINRFRILIILIVIVITSISGYVLFLIKNVPPMFVSQPVETAKIGDLYVYNIEAKDFNKDDVLTITVPEKPSWLNFTDNGKGKAILQGILTSAIASQEPNQYYAVKLQVTDNHGANSTQSFKINALSNSYLSNIVGIVLILFVFVIFVYIIFSFVKPNLDFQRITVNLLSLRKHKYTQIDDKPYLQRELPADEKLPFSSLTGTKQRTKIRKIKKFDGFVLTDEYFPLTRRQMKQSWRYLRKVIRKGLPTELDIDATIKQIVAQGIFIEPILVPPKVNKTNLILLIDRDGSMLPFHIFSERLTETAVRGGRLQQANTYYFHNCPIDYLYQDSYFQEAEIIHDVIGNFQSQNAVVLFFSDAGAARGGFNSERLELTKDFLVLLRKRVNYIAWLNPMPRSRWIGTTAYEIAKIVPMFELNRRGLDNAINILRGNLSSGYRQ